MKAVSYLVAFPIVSALICLYKVLFRRALVRLLFPQYVMRLRFCSGRYDNCVNLVALASRCSRSDYDCLIATVLYRFTLVKTPQQ